MKQSKVYNFSKIQQTVTIGDRNITIGAGNHAWFPKPSKNIFINTELGQIFFPTSADSIFLTETQAGTNLTMRYGNIENKSRISIYATDRSGRSYAVLPYTNVEVMFSNGDVWEIENPMSGTILGKVKMTDGKNRIIFDGEKVQAK